MAAIFDTHAFVKKLTEAGFTERQAEVQADTLAAIIDDKMATKRDLKELEVALKELEVALKRDLKELEVTLKRDIEEFKGSIKRDLKELEDRTTFRMAELEYRLIIKLGAMMAGSIAAVAALVKLL
jgi:predicted phage-related endonuclease